MWSVHQQQHRHQLVVCSRQKYFNWLKHDLSVIKVKDGRDLCSLQPSSPPAGLCEHCWRIKVRGRRRNSSHTTLLQARRKLPVHCHFPLSLRCTGAAGLKTSRLCSLTRTRRQTVSSQLRCREGRGGLQLHATMIPNIGLCSQSLRNRRVFSRAVKVLHTPWTRQTGLPAASRWVWHTNTHMHIHTCMNLMNKEHCSVEITFTFNLKAHMFVVLFILNSECNSFTIHVHLSKVKPFQLVAFWLLLDCITKSTRLLVIWDHIFVLAVMMFTSHIPCCAISSGSVH